MLSKYGVSTLTSLAAFFKATRSTMGGCQTSLMPTPDVYGASILSISAIKVVDPSLSSTSTAFCNISIAYTHTDKKDLINIWLWLPEVWNGRFQGVGGGGWAAGLIAEDLIKPVDQGYAAVTTDGGHSMMTPAQEWGLSGLGKVDMNALENFASITLNDMTLIGKQLTEAYYGKSIFKSYWNGCSTGGRQGLMMAQKYPDAYDGILANAPGINWAEFIPATFWPQRIMKEKEYFPSQCELEAISNAAIEACDGHDGVKDGVIANTYQCNFQAAGAIGQPYNCGQIIGSVSAKAADIVQSIWDGARYANGTFQWYGLNPGSPLDWIANTTCTANGTCTGLPFHMATDWFQVFIRSDPHFDAFSMTQSEWDAAFQASVERYASIIGTNNPDLSSFKASGGKMITWHGTADQAVFFNGTVDYYDRVLALDSHAIGFYRFFTAPGVEHCGGGHGPVPADALAALVHWVEKNEAPDILMAARTINGTDWTQGLCAYPRSSVFRGGDPSRSNSYRCE